MSRPASTHDQTAPGAARSGGASAEVPGIAGRDYRAVVEFLLDNLVWLMLIIVLTVFSLTIPQYFQIGIFANIVEQSTFVGVMAIGLAIVIIAGNMDLSVESVAALTAMVTGILFCSRGIGLGITLTPEWLVIPVSLALALFIGGIIGVINGLLVVRLRMNAFIVTLASYLGARPGSGDLGRPLGPGPDAVAALHGHRDHRLCAADRLARDRLLCAVHLHHGEDAVRAPRHHDRRQPGRNVPGRHQGRPANPITFILSGAISGLAGWLLAIRTSGATANLGVGMLFNAFAAVVIGGVSLKGGIGRLPGVYAGVLLLSSIHTAINLMGLPAHYTQMILGALVLAAVLIDTVKLQIRQKLA